MSTEQPQKIRIWRDQNKLMKQLVPGEVKEVQAFRQYSKSLIKSKVQAELKEGLDTNHEQS